VLYSERVGDHSMLGSDAYMPIQRFGYALIVLGISGLLVLFFQINNAGSTISIWLFIAIVSAYHLLLGIGVVRRNKFLFGLFKSYLRMLYIAFPIGTYISRETSRYIDENNIDSYLR
jgi:hypothetical protein